MGMIEYVPGLAAGNLHNQNVVVVPVIFEALRVCWSDVSIGLNRGSQGCSHFMAEMCDSAVLGFQGWKHETIA